MSPLVTVKLASCGRASLQSHALWPELAIRYTGMVFIRQDVAVWFQLKQDEEVQAWHTVPYRPTSGTACHSCRNLFHWHRTIVLGLWTVHQVAEVLWAPASLEL